MNESAKASKLESRQNLYRQYLRGRVLDIGCGQDKLVAPGCEVDGWDKENGDAEYLSGIPLYQYDSIYSSHCLEHMNNVTAALQTWGCALKPGGHMLIVVPDFVLYEHQQWPSRFNDDHKASFSLFAGVGTHPTFYTTAQMIEMGRKAGLEIVDVCCECAHYDFHLLQYPFDQTLGKACANVVYVYRKL